MTTKAVVGPGRTLGDVVADAIHLSACEGGRVEVVVVPFGSPWRSELGIEGWWLISEPRPVTPVNGAGAVVHDVVGILETGDEWQLVVIEVPPVDLVW